jgi:septum site-determining protein MinD
MSDRTLALVGAAGGAGTTRLALEAGVLAARAGHDVAVLDAAFATQGLADYLEGRLAPDLTAHLVEEAPLADVFVAYDAGTEGALRLAPVRAPVERLARAKTAGAAQRFEAAVAAAAEQNDLVLVDTPPVAANQAVAAVNATRRTAVVVPATDRGRDALARERARLQDVGQGVDLTVATRADGDGPDADVTVPEAALAPHRPACLEGESPFQHAVASLLDAAIGVDATPPTWTESTGLDRFLPGT